GAVMLEWDRQAQGDSQAQRMRELLRHGKRLLVPLAGLVWIAKCPQDQRQIGEALHSGVSSSPRQRTVLLGVVEGNLLLQVRARRGPLRQKVQRLPDGEVRAHEEEWVVHALGQGEALLGQLPCRLIVRPDQIKKLQAL